MSNDSGRFPFVNLACPHNPGMFIYTLKCTIDFVLLTIITGDDFFHFAIGLFNHKEKHDHHTELPFFYVFMQEDQRLRLCRK